MKFPRTSYSSQLILAALLVLTACTPKAGATPDAMMGEETPTTDAMMMEETPTADAMMQDAPTADAMMQATPASPDASMQKAAWLGTPLTDAATGQEFRISDHEGKVVLVETMAVWCSTCRAQQEQIKLLHTQMMEQTRDLVSVSLDIDANENAGTLKKYVEVTGFDWAFAVAPAELARTIGSSYGDQFLNPPSAPVLIIDRKGVAHPLPFGIKSANDLMKAIQPYLEGSM